MRWSSDRTACVAALMVAMAACGGGESGSSAPQTTEAATTLTLSPASSSTTSIATRTPGAQPMPALSELQLGVRYEPADVIPAISFEVPASGWTSYPMPPFKITDLIDLGKNVRPENDEADVSVSVLRVTDVWTKFLVPDPVQPLEAQYVVSAPQDLVGWFRNHPYLRLSEPAATTVAGLPATTFTAEVPPLPAEAEGTCHGARCTVLFSLESTAGYTAQAEGETSRYWVVDAGSERFVCVLTIGSGVDPAQRDALLKEGEALVASIQIR